MALQHQKLLFGDESFDHYYLCHYIPRKYQSDGLSRSLINFKMGDPIHVEAWTSCALLELTQATVVSDHTIILRALQSTETSAADPATSSITLDTLGCKLAQSRSATYCPQLLSKAHVTQSVKFLSREDRVRTLKDVYHFEASFVDADILLIDDILTTGATLFAIIEAIRAVREGCQIQLFTLAYTEYQRILNKQLALTGYEYAWQTHQGWVLQEEAAVYGEMAVVQLMRQIMSNSFD